MTATTWADWPPREPITLTDLNAEARVLSIGILPIGGYVSGPARLNGQPGRSFVGPGWGEGRANFALTFSLLGCRNMFECLLAYARRLLLSGRSPSN